MMDDFPWKACIVYSIFLSMSYDDHYHYDDEIKIISIKFGYVQIKTMKYWDWSLHYMLRLAYFLLLRNAQQPWL